MILDSLLEVSTAQAVSNVTPVLSTSSIDLKGATRADELEFVVNLSTVAGVTTPSFKVEIVAADDAGLTTNLISVAAVTQNIVAGQAAKNIYIEAPPSQPKQFYGLRYTLGGADNSVVVTAGIALDVQVDYKAP